MVMTLGDFLATGGLTAWFSCAVVIVFTIENKVRMTKPDTIFFMSAPFAFVMIAMHRRRASVRQTPSASDQWRRSFRPRRDGFPSCARSGRTGAPGRAGRGRLRGGTAPSRQTTRGGAGPRRYDR